MTFLQAAIDTAVYLLAIGVPGYVLVWFLSKALDWFLDVEGRIA